MANISNWYLPYLYGSYTDFYQNYEHITFILFLCTFTNLANLWVVLQLHLEHPHGRFGGGQLLTRAHFVEQVAEADDVHVFDLGDRSGPHDGVNARTEAQEAILEAR